MDGRELRKGDGGERREMEKNWTHLGERHGGRDERGRERGGKKEVEL